MLTFKIKLNKQTFNKNMAVAEKSSILQFQNHNTNRKQSK